VEYLEKLSQDLMKAVPGTTEYDYISSMIELQQRISAAYIRLEDNLKLSINAVSGVLMGMVT